MIIKNNFQSIHKVLLILYIFLDVCLMGYSNLYEMLLCIAMTTICIGDFLNRRYTTVGYAKNLLFVIVIFFVILSNLVLGRSTGNVGNIYLQLNFILFIANIIYILRCYDNKSFAMINNVIFGATLISLIYNIYICSTNIGLRETIYLYGSSDTISYIGIGGVNFSFYVSCFGIINLYGAMVARSNKSKAIRFIMFLVSGYYIAYFVPAATVVILFIIASFILIMKASVLNKLSKKQQIIIVALFLLAIPFLILPALNIVYSKINPSSRLYERIAVIIEVFNNPSVLLTSIYFSRFQMIISEIKLVFSSITVFFFGTGYNLKSFASIDQQMNEIGIGYHCSMLDWFPTYGIVCGIPLWILFKELNDLIKNTSIVTKLVWGMFIAFCFLDYGFSTMLLLMACLYSKRYKNDLVEDNI